MNDNVIKAILILQKRSKQQFYSSPYWTERIDLAIDIILRNTYSTKPPNHLVRNALSDARKKIHGRKKICLIVEPKSLATNEQLQPELENIPDRSINFIETSFAIRHWLNQARLKEKERLILNILLAGGEAQEVATFLHLSIKQARVCISRTRKRALKLWREDTYT